MSGSATTTADARRGAADARAGGSAAEAPLRVAIVVPSLRGGGLERLARDTAIMLRQRGWTPAVFCIGAGALGVYADELRALGIRVGDARRRRLRLPGLSLPLVRQLHAFRPDVIHAHSGAWLPSVVAKLLLRGPRLVFTDHGRYPPEPRLRALLERWCYARTDAFVAVTSALADYVMRYLRPRRRPAVILNGVDLSPYDAPDAAERARLRREWGVGAEDVLVMAVGRFAPVKNHAGLLRALARAVAAAPSLRLALLGSGPLEAEVRAQAATLGLADRVSFLGFRSDVAGCLLAADCFVNSSTTEALPVSLLEAMAAGLPTVAPRIGGIPEALGQPPAGIVVEPGDMDALGDALARIALEPELRRRLGARARERASHFSLDAFIAQHCALYTAVVNSAPKEPA